MIPRARHTDIAAPAKNDVMALSIMTGEATHRTRPANDVKAEDRQNLLVAAAAASPAAKRTKPACRRRDNRFPCRSWRRPPPAPTLTSPEG